ncbi:MAG: PA14 domain-containing protein [Candidatus Woesearchaeota archaeon]
MAMLNRNNMMVFVLAFVLLLVVSSCLPPPENGFEPEPDPDPAPSTVEEGTGLRGSYFDSSTGERLLVRDDATIDFDWHLGSPYPIVPEDYFSAVWKGYIRAPEPGDYIFSVRIDDGFRLFIEGELVAESWKNQGGPRGDEPLYDSTKVTLGAELIPIRLEYYEAYATAVIRLKWRETSKEQSEMQVVDTEYLYPGEPAVTMPQGAPARPDEDPDDEPPTIQPPPSFDGTYGPRDVPRSRDPRADDIFVSSTGTGDCSQQNPCSLVQGVARGGQIWMSPGVYTHSGQLRLGSNNVLESIDPNDKAVIDFEYSPESRLVITDSNELRNIVVRQSSQVGIVIWGNHNLIEGVISEHNRGSGIHLWPIGSGYSDLKEPDGASYNTIRDTIARYNDDLCAGTGATTCTLSHADGISISAGRGNLIEYSAAYSNTDDGFDFWRSYMGTIRYSVAYGNGYNLQGNRAGHGIGYKMGSGEGPIPTNHLISSNWAYNNAGAPFSRNSGQEAVFENNVCGHEKEPCGPSW